MMRKNHLAKTAVAMICILCMLCCHKAFADSDLSNNDDCENASSFQVAETSIFQNELLTQFGNLKQDSLEYDGNELALYPVFVNKQEAWNTFLSSCGNAISDLKNTYNLPEICFENCGTYFSCALMERGNIEQISAVAGFLDVFKTYEKNEKIRDIVQNNPIPSDEIRVLLASLLPYGNPYQAMIQADTNRAWNITDAVTYAQQYATLPNILNYTYMPTGDCANFASQIRYAGGISMSYSWHYYGSSDYTDSWAYADDFIRRLVPCHEASHDFRTLTIYASAGDFISYDETGNGDYDHVGFVTQRDTYSYRYEVINNGYSYGYINYFDMKIAQHTTNYHRWISADNNNWDVVYFTESSCKFISVQA